MTTTMTTHPNRLVCGIVGGSRFVAANGATIAVRKNGFLSMRGLLKDVPGLVAVTRRGRGGEMQTQTRYSLACNANNGKNAGERAPVAAACRATTAKDDEGTKLGRKGKGADKTAGSGPKDTQKATKIEKKKADAVESTNKMAPKIAPKSTTIDISKATAKCDANAKTVVHVEEGTAASCMLTPEEAVAAAAKPHGRTTSRGMVPLAIKATMAGHLAGVAQGKLEVTFRVSLPPPHV